MYIPHTISYYSYMDRKKSSGLLITIISYNSIGNLIPTFDWNIRSQYMYMYLSMLQNILSDLEFIFKYLITLN